MTLEANIGKHRDDFLRKLFTEGEYCEELFRKLCKEGCSDEDLASLLFGVCTLAVGDRRGLIVLDRTNKISTAQVRRLAKDLRSLADLVDGVNKTSLNPKLDILSAPADASRDPTRKYVARLYDMLPSVMRVYSMHLEHFSKFNRALLKRLTVMHFLTLRLLLYVEESTGGPRYEDTSNLLIAGFLTAGGAEDKVPTFFTPDALAKLKQRTAKFGLSSRS
jgi:hypothetical protein